MVFFEVILSVLIVSAISLIGIFTIFLKEKTFEKSLWYMISFSTGVLLGTAFLDLIPESIESGGAHNAMIIALIGFLLFFILEKLILWHHCHEKKCIHPQRKTSLPYLNTIGDGVHNLMDGMVIASAYLTDPSLGIITTIAIIAHEIPQEIGDFGVLIYGGMTRSGALAINLLTALTAVIGALLILFLDPSLQKQIAGFMIPLVAGHFIYIASADLIPELQKVTNKKESIIHLIFIFLGIFLMVFVGNILAH